PRNAVRFRFRHLAGQRDGAGLHLHLHRTGMLHEVAEAGADALVQAGVVDGVGGQLRAGLGDHALQLAGGMLALAAHVMVGVLAGSGAAVAGLGAAPAAGNGIEEVHGGRARRQRRGQSDDAVHRWILWVGEDRSLPPAPEKPCEEGGRMAASVQLASATSTPSRPWLRVRASPPWGSLMRRRTSLAESA